MPLTNAALLAALCLGLGVTAAAPSAARAMEATLSLQAQSVYEGQTTTLTLQVTNPEGALGTPSLVLPEGLIVRGPSPPMNQTYVINGRRSISVSYTYSVAAPAGKGGSYTIGPATIALAGGKTVRTNAVALQVLKRPDMGVRFRVQVSPAGGPVGAPFRVVYTASYAGDVADESGEDFFPLRGSSRPFGLTALDLPVLKLAGVRVQPTAVRPREQASRLQLGEDSVVLVQTGVETDAEGNGHRTLSFAFEVTPLATGRIALPPATIGLALRTGKTRVVEDFFTRRRVAEAAEYTAQTEAATYVVEELPREGRPPGFTGAVGRYRIEVSAFPTETDQYAPITLEVRVTGDGLVDELKPPAWSEIESLSRSFDVSSDVDTGKTEEGWKVFRQTLRATQADVTEIPPIPFPYYDPAAKRYEVATSKPIPIRVRPVKTVSVEDAVSSGRAAPSATLEAVPRSIAELAGIGANYEELGPPRPALDPRAQILEGTFLGAVLAPPALFLALLGAVRLRRRDPAGRERRQALARSRAAVEGAASMEALSASYQDYLRARLGLPPGEVTPPELVGKLAAGGVPESVRAGAVDLLGKLLAGRFGGVTETVEELRRGALRAIREVDRCRLG
jgi:hypothetical protein